MLRQLMTSEEMHVLAVKMQMSDFQNLLYACSNLNLLDE